MARLPAPANYPRTHAGYPGDPAAGGIIHRAGAPKPCCFCESSPLSCRSEQLGCGNRATTRPYARKDCGRSRYPDEALAALHAAPDVLQLDKFTLSRQQASLARHRLWPPLHAGADWRHYLASLASPTVASDLITAPYYAPPADIKVSLSPDAHGV